MFSSTLYAVLYANRLIICPLTDDFNCYIFTPAIIQVVYLSINLFKLCLILAVDSLHLAHV